MSDTNFIREIDEEVRRDRMLALWQRYQTLIVLAVALVVFGTAGWRGWQWYEARESMKASARYEQALVLSQSGKTSDAEQELAGIVKDAPSGYRMLARLWLASDAAKHDAAAGVKAFDEIAADRSVDPVLRDVAKLRAVLLLVDTAPSDELEKRVEPLAGVTAPFRNSAKEALALSYYRTGANAKARSLYKEILADPEVTSALANRAQIMTALIPDNAPAKPAATQ